MILHDIGVEKSKFTQTTSNCEMDFVNISRTLKLIKDCISLDSIVDCWNKRVVNVAMHTLELGSWIWPKQNIEIIKKICILLNSMINHWIKSRQYVCTYIKVGTEDTQMCFVCKFNYNANFITPKLFTWNYMQSNQTSLS